MKSTTPTTPTARPHTHHHRWVAGAALSLAVAGVALAPPAAAATTYTWIGGDGTSWSTADNWSPAGVPGNGDSVVVTAIPGKGRIDVDQVPAVSLANLTLSSTDASYAHLGSDGENLTVTGAFTWTGGQLTTGLTLAPGAVGQVAEGATKALWGPMDVQGTLNVENTVLPMSWGDTITVAPGGTLSSSGTAEINGASCCGEPNQVINHGTITVASGTLDLKTLGLDQFGTVQLPAGTQVVADKGVVRLESGGRYAGAGTLAFSNTTAPEPDPLHPDAYQGGIFATGTSTFADGFHLAVGQDSELTGVATFAGAGNLDLGSAIVYADVSLDPAMHLSVTGAETALSVWDPDVAGYHGRVTLAGAGAVAPTASLSIAQRTQLVLAKGGSFTVPGGATLLAPTCCSSDDEVVGQAGSTLTLGGGAGTTKVDWLNVRTEGSVALADHATVEVSKGRWIQSGGTTTLGPGAALSLSETSYSLVGGTLTGKGTLRGTVRNTHGTVRPVGARGKLKVGSYVQGKRGRLAVEVSGHHAGRLLVTGRATLSGRLTIRHKTHGHALKVVTAKKVRVKKLRATRGWKVEHSNRALTIKHR